MDKKAWCILFLFIAPVLITAWRSSPSDRRDIRDQRRPGVHYHTKRHMLTNQTDFKRRSTTIRPRELKRMKPSGNLIPLEEDDIDNDEIISVAIGPPPIRPKLDKVRWKHIPKPINRTFSSATNLVRDILSQLGREFLTSEVSEDFVFGQYLGNSMRNLSTELRLKMQHEILELIVKYQKINRGEIAVKVGDTTSESALLKENRVEKKLAGNETEDMWPDFSNLAKIVG